MQQQRHVEGIRPAAGGLFVFCLEKGLGAPGGLKGLHSRQILIRVIAGGNVIKMMGIPMQIRRIEGGQIRGKTAAGGSIKTGGFRADHFRHGGTEARCQFGIDGFEGLGIAGIIGCLGRFISAGIPVGSPVRFILDAEIVHMDAQIIPRRDAVCKPFGQFGVGIIRGASDQRSAAACLAVAFQISRRRPAGNQHLQRASQGGTACGDDFGGAAHIFRPAGLVAGISNAVDIQAKVAKQKIIEGCSLNVSGEHAFIPGAGGSKSFDGLKSSGCVHLNRGLIGKLRAEDGGIIDV